MNITVALCTRERPIMLSECLRSIQSLVIPKNVKLHLVVVENAESPNCRNNATRLMSATPDIGFSYILEKKLGISSARNTSVETALKTNPDWIAFIDDDEVVTKCWLVNYQKAILTNSADVFTGPVDRVLTVEPPIWYKKPRTMKYENLSKVDMAATNNTIAKAQFFNGEKMKLRFDESYNFSGGEDTKLFSELAKRGGIIRFVENALVVEHRSKDRAEKKWLIRSSFHSGNLTARMHIEALGKLDAIKFYFGGFTSRVYLGILNSVWGILILPFSKRYIRYLVKGLSKLFWTIGFTAGLFNFTDKYYRDRIDGN